MVIRPITLGGSGNSTSQADIDAARAQADIIKNAGIRMLALGIGNDLSVDNLKAISGTNVNTGNVLTSDVITSDFSTLSTQLSDFAKQTCGGTITTKKLIDADGNLQTTNDQTPAVGWTFDINGGSNPDATVTDANGQTPAVKVNAGSGYSVSEESRSGYTLLSAGCTGATNNGDWTSGGLIVSGIQVGANDIISCTFINKQDKGGVQLVKEVVNNNGGTLGVNDFGLSIGGTSVTSGQTVTLPVGVPVAVNEAGAAGYDFVSITGVGCPATLGGTVTLVKDQTIICTIKNDDKPATLIVNKILKNDNGGTKQITDFSYQINGGSATAFEADGSNSHSVNAGTYSVVEVSDTSYTTTYSNCSNIVLTNGASATCTITNDDKPATITLSKTVVNQYGGTKQPADFIPSLSGIGSVFWGVPVTVNAGTYTASESTFSGYASQGWTGDCAVNGVVTVANGQNKACSITNTDVPASLSGTKTIGNADLSWVAAGANPASGWIIFLDQNQNGLLDADEASTVTDTNGNYSFTGLSASVSYYVKEIIPTLSGWEQITGVANPVIISTVGGSSAGNNFTNTAYGTITVIKQIEPANDVGKFNLLIDGTTKVINGGDNATTGSVKIEAGTYDVAETAGENTSLTDYNSAWRCEAGLKWAEGEASTTAVTVGPGEDWTCTFTNTRKNGTVKVIKDVVNNNGGTKTAAQDFTFTNNGSGSYGFDETNSPDGERILTLPVGASFDIKEVQENTGGYTTTYSGVCSGTVTAQQQVCTVKNDDQPATLIVKKHVINDNGGTKTAGQFTMHVTGTNVSAGSFAGSEAGVTVTLDAGEYTVDETADSSYAKSLDSSCSGSIGVGETKTCVITNDDRAPSLTLVKEVKNLHGGTAQATNWILSATGPTSISGAGGVSSGSDFKAGTYRLSETGLSGYDASAWDCAPIEVSPRRSITIQPGESVTCTITNTDRPVNISGFKTLDNVDLSWVAGGTNPVSGWVIYLDQNQNGILDADEQWTTTNALGYYSFSGLDSNTTYYVSEVITGGSGWVQKDAPSPVIIAKSGDSSRGNNFRNQAQGTLTVIKTVDNGFGKKKPAKGWTWNYTGLQARDSNLTASKHNVQTVPSGTYLVSENQQPDYHFQSVTCRQDGGAPWQKEVKGTIFVTVGLGKHVVCEFTNERDTGTITVHKQIGEQTDPAGWRWWFERSRGSHAMGDTVKVVTGTYRFGEKSQQGYSFVSLVCTKNGERFEVTQSTSSEVTVGSNDHVDCTFTNSRNTGDVTIIKDAQPNSKQDFTFTIEPVSTKIDEGAEQIVQKAVSGQQSEPNNPTVSFALIDTGDGNNSQLTSLPTGMYRISEASVEGWDLSNISCGESKVKIKDGVVYLRVTKGASVTCTFTNTQRAQLTIVKDARPNATRSFSFTSTISDGLGGYVSFGLTDDGSGLANSKLFEGLKPGTYTITETAASAWELDDIVCTGTGVSMSRSGYILTVTLEPGAAANCTFVNSFVPQVLEEADPGKGAELFNTGTETTAAIVAALLLIMVAVGVSIKRHEIHPVTKN